MMEGDYTLCCSTITMSVVRFSPANFDCVKWKQSVKQAQQVLGDGEVSSARSMCLSNRDRRECQHSS